MQENVRGRGAGHDFARVGVWALVQARLDVSQPDDPYEREADHVADDVMRMPQADTSAVDGRPAPLPGIVAQPVTSKITPLAQRQENSEPESPGEREETGTSSAPLQRQAQSGTGEEEDEERAANEAAANTPAGGGPVQRQVDAPESDEEKDRKKPVQTKHANGSSPRVAAGVAAGTNRTQGQGAPLPASTRGFFEPRFGYDFSRVRIHADTAAAEDARRLNAQAYTCGQNIVFGAGHYQPDSLAGRHLLAHELTHVVQQQGRPPVRQFKGAAAVASVDTAALDRLRKKPPERIEDASAWKSFSVALADPALEGEMKSLLGAYFVYFIETKPEITFENITSGERTLFLNKDVLSPVERERLRLVALQNSALFKALTEVTIDLSGSAADVAARRMAMNKARLGGGKEFLEAEPGAAAAKFINYEIPVEVLFNDTPAAGANGPLIRYVNWLRKNKPEALKETLENKTWMYACGLGNLFALSVARAKAAPTIDGAKQWFKHWTIDQPPANAMIRVDKGAFSFWTSPVLSSLATAGAVDRSVDKESGSRTPATFRASLNRHRARIAGGGKEARLGLVQGIGSEGAHMYITYLDMDAVWRTMDIYLFLEDRPEGGREPLTGNYTVKLWQKLLVDSPPEGGH
jgi:hypothetical protein